MENGSNSCELKSVMGHDQWTNSPKAAIASSERASSPVATDGVSN